MPDSRINAAPPDVNPVTDLPSGFYDFLVPLHRAFTPRQQALVKQRAQATRRLS